MQTPRRRKLPSELFRDPQPCLALARPRRRAPAALLEAGFGGAAAWPCSCSRGRCSSTTTAGSSLPGYGRLGPDRDGRRADRRRPGRDPLAGAGPLAAPLPAPRPGDRGDPRLPRPPAGDGRRSSSSPCGSPRVNTATLAVGGAFTAVLLGLAAQQTLGGIFAGIVLQSTRPFRVGERVRLVGGALAGSLEGTVSSLGLFYTTLSQGADRLLVPNNVLLNLVVVAAARARESRRPGPLPVARQPPADRGRLLGGDHRPDPLPAERLARGDRRRRRRACGSTRRRCAPRTARSSPRRCSRPCARRTAREAAAWRSPQASSRIARLARTASGVADQREAAEEGLPSRRGSGRSRKG